MGPPIQMDRTIKKTQICTKCNQEKELARFAPTRSLFYPNHHIPLCAECINQIIKDKKGDWGIIDKLCQYADIPFIPKEWTKTMLNEPVDTFLKYSQLFLNSEFDGFGWGEYFKEFQRLREEGELNTQIPLLDERDRKMLVKKWNAEYSDEEFAYLEDLLDGMYKTQNINTKIQQDDALKLCKISLEIDSRIREGAEVDKLLGSYEKLIKIANFTPKNSKSASDLESIGELARWLEDGGWRNKFYDGVTRDIVDEEMKNQQTWTQRLYVNETGIGEEITRRIEALKIADSIENSTIYGEEKKYDLIQDEANAYNELSYIGDEEEEFVVNEDDIGDDANGED